jgi:polysaccharide deacetylase 2 family uncharacterized protein YibQ
MRKRNFKDKFIRGLNNSWTPVVVGLFVILIVLGVRVFRVEANRTGSGGSMVLADPPIEALKDTLECVLKAQNVMWKTYRGSNRTEIWTANVPARLPIPCLHLNLQGALQGVEASILSTTSDPMTGRLSLDVGWEDSCFVQIILVPIKEEWPEQGDIALIIDDFGHQWNFTIQSFLDFEDLITISILPGERYSRKVALEAEKKGCEVILHLPMEPISADYRKNEFIVLYRMPRHKIREVIQKSLNSVPGAVGVNNHMGSRVTSDRNTITDVLEELQVRNLYFIDSRTVAESVAFDVARELNIRCGKRDVFFDFKLEPQTIRSSLSKLAKKAETNGYAIGIGHCYDVTLHVLQEEIPKYQAKGYRFKKVSHVID